MSWPRFDSTVTLGHVLTILSILVGGMTAYTGVVARVVAGEIRITQLESQQKDLIQAMKDLAAVQRDVAVIRDRLDRGSNR